MRNVRQGHRALTRARQWVLGIALMGAFAAANAAVQKLAPGFANLPKSAKLAVMPVDVELFSLSAGGVAEPKSDWTTIAQQHMRAQLRKMSEQMGLAHVNVGEQEAETFAEPIALHAAVARSIALHHAIDPTGPFSLPTKAGQLNWSFGDAMQGVQSSTGADYGLFIWVRDSYASAERKAAMVALALLGVGLTAGQQIGYASLVDLKSGQVLWFNRLARGTGDLREAASAAETIAELLRDFPRAQ